MKFEVVFKDPDALHECVRTACRKDLAAAPGLTDEERNAVFDMRVDSVLSLCNRWFKWSEYLTVEVDTDAQTCTVLPGHT